ncbi:MAG: hypothetical protein V3T17_18240 [Pseudomonadales bacterium]
MSKIILGLCVAALSSVASAGMINNGTWAGWTQFADDGIVGPGGGGEMFDTEYFLYKYNANTNVLSIGLQTACLENTQNVARGGLL